MSKKSEYIEYHVDQRTFKGYLAYPDPKKTKLDFETPALIVGPTWMGFTPFICQICDQLANLGYIAFGLDFFGKGESPNSPEEAKAWIKPLLEDREILRSRLQGALNFIRDIPHVDQKKIAGVGYCFGGLAMLELAKSGADLLGVISIHGVLGNPHGFLMKPVKDAEQIPASILILHGYNDPLVSDEDLLNFEREMSEKKADWQVHVYGQASHAFTNPEAHDEKEGLIYHEKSAQRAWKIMLAFLEELF